MGLVIVAVAAVLGVSLLASGGSERYRVAVVFDTARGIIPGNEVKVAGVGVGTVKATELAPGPKARIVLDVAEQSGPFYEDATCTILPEGLISESFVQCDPGSSRSGELGGGRSGTPTVPVTRTTIPASLQQFLDVFSVPVADRLRVMLNELGIGTAGRGEDINAVLVRSNPALGQARRVLSIIEEQRDQLATGISQTNRVLASVARKSDDVRSFVDHAATVAQTSAARQTELALAVRRLPGLLDEVRPGLRSLDRVVTQATPVLNGLRSAAPALNTTTRELPKFADAAVPALNDLGSAARVGQTAVRAAAPVVTALKGASAKAVPFATQLNRLLLGLRDSGGFEGTLRLLYSFATLASGYDQTSHIMGLAAGVLPQCFAPGGAPGCSANFSAPGNGTIPTNNPSCGAHSGATWDPPTTCQSFGNIAGPPPAPAEKSAAKTKRPSLLPGRGEQPATQRPSQDSQRTPPVTLPPVTLPPVKIPPVKPPPIPESLERVLDYLLGP